MKRCFVAALAVLAFGCGPGGEYDAIHNETKVRGDVVDRREKDDLRTEMSVTLTGEGKYPRKWSGYVTLTLHRPRTEGLPVAESDRLLVGPEWLDVKRDYEAYVRDYPAYPESSVAQQIHVNMGIEDVVYLAESAKRFQIGKLTLSLTTDEVDLLKRLIIKAREVTNAG